MNFLFAASFILATTHTTALKLLDSKNAKMLAGEDLGEDLGENLVEDDDEDWESDIEFSYKPFQGKCKKNPGAATALDKTPETNGGNNGMYHKAGGTDGVLSTKPCTAGAQKASDFATYCSGQAAVTGTPIDPLTFEDLLSGWMPYFIKEEKKTKCPHYYAKLASMSNKEITKLGAASSLLIESFEITTDCIGTVFIDLAVSGDKTADIFCYTAAGMAWAKNDPKVKNMHGEEFEIMATGAFSMLKLETSSQQTVLEVLATIDRSGTQCGATYIQNISLGGQWVQDVGVPHIHIKAAAIGPKSKALQIKFDEEWQHATSHFAYAAVQRSSAKQFVLKLHEVTMKVSVDSHRIHENGVKTKRFTNFLNINFAGISQLSNLSVGGLLGNDSHDAAEKLPEGCKPTNLMATKESAGMLSDVDVA